jgi:hypothetical protein
MAASLMPKSSLWKFGSTNGKRALKAEEGKHSLARFGSALGHIP